MTGAPVALDFLPDVVLPTKANTHGAATDLVEYHLGRELIRPSGTAAGLEEARLSRCLYASSGSNHTIPNSIGFVFVALRWPRVRRIHHSAVILELVGVE